MLLRLLQRHPLPPSVSTSHTVRPFPSDCSPLVSSLLFLAIPIALRVINRDTFVRGPFHLGAFSYPVAIAAVVWIMFISIVFMLPQINPVNSQTLNYAPVAVGIVIAYSLGFWVLSARKWFTGPIKQIQGTCISNASSQLD